MFYEGITGANWKNGFFGAVDLPVSASPEDVVNKSYGNPRFPSQILEMKRIWIPFEGEVCWVARLKDGGHDGRIKTLLLYFRQGPDVLLPGSAGSWIVKEYY
jgi:hypothetical protein